MICYTLFSVLLVFICRSVTLFNLFALMLCLCLVCCLDNRSSVLIVVWFVWVLVYACECCLVIVIVEFKFGLDV